MRRPIAALLSATALLAACDAPLLGARLEIRELRITMPGQEFPESPVDALSFCAHPPGDPPPPGCVARTVSYDLGAELPVLDDEGITADVRLTDLGLRLTSGAGGDLGGITLVRISVVDPATGALIPVASYARSGTASAPTTLAVTGDPNLDLAPYLDAGSLDVRVEVEVDPADPPGAFTAEVEVAFSVVVTVDYAAYL